MRAAIVALALTLAPASANAAEPDPERERRVGSGLLWGGVASAGVGALTMLGIIPTHKNLRAAEAARELCLRDAPECPTQDAEIQRWTVARGGVAADIREPWSWFASTRLVSLVNKIGT